MEKNQTQRTKKKGEREKRGTWGENGDWEAEAKGKIQIAKGL